MSSSFSASSTSPSSQPTVGGGGGGGGPTGQNNGSGVSSSLYLFTFLITVLVLAIISSALLFRAYYIRRRFQTRVEEAIRNNQPLPPDAARALGLRPTGANGKKDKRLGPMPAMWEAEMLLDRKAGEVDQGAVDRETREDRVNKKWDEFTPLSIMQQAYTFTPEPLTPQYIIPPARHRRYLPSWIPISQPLPRIATEVEETPATITRSKPNFTIPPPGESLTVGVLIALPFEEKMEDVWMRNMDESGEEMEMEVPQVQLGVLAIKVE